MAAHAQAGSFRLLAHLCRQRDIASLLAVAPATLCRITAKFKRFGWIETRAQGIFLRDSENLATLLS